jgi:hypothetical protein
VRGPDGEEVITVKEVLERWEKDGRVMEEVRRKQMRKLADDLPWVARQYRGFVQGQPFEVS